MKPLEIPEGVLNQIARAQKVSEGELEALKLALQKRKSKDIAKQLDISEAAARKRLGEVYKKFGIKGRGPGKLASLEATLGKTLTDYDLTNLDRLPKAGVDWKGKAPLHARATHYDWGEAPELNTFQGRTEPLEKLKRWVDTPADAPKLLAICGIGGIGKSYLARRLAREIGNEYERVIWISLDERKAPDKQLRSLLTKLQPLPSTIPLRRASEGTLASSQPTAASKAPKQSVASEKSLHETCHSLIRQIVALFIQQSSCIVLDGFDKIFKGYNEQDRAAAKNSEESTEKESVLNKRADTFSVSRKQQSSLYQDGFEVYGQLLMTLQKCRNRKGLSRSSCLVITSRERPRELSSLKDNAQNSRLYTLDGLTDAEATDMLAVFKLSGTEADYAAFVERYYGHPMALKLSANTVKEVFYGRIRDFLEQEISVFDDLRSILKSQFKRLPPEEKEVMYWLAINHRACTLEELREDVVAEDRKSNLLYTLKSLQRRSLIQIDRQVEGAIDKRVATTEGTASFRLHPIVAEYVLDRFVRSIFQDLMRYDLQMFNDYALMKADAEDETRAFQLANIVQPILKRLKNYWKSLYQVDAYLSDRLDRFREHNPHRLGYAGGNFVNLLVQLSQGQALEGKDFSQLTIWQAYLQSVQLKEVTFSQCQLDRSVFTETLSDVMASAFSKAPLQPPLLAAADANGVVHIWPTQSGKASHPKCFGWVAHSSWVRAMSFVPGQPLLVTGGDDSRLKLWRLPSSQQGLSQPTQVWQKDADDWIHAVAVSIDGGIIASGGEDKVTLYRTSSGEMMRQLLDPTGRDRTRALAFSPDGRWLASGGDDGSVRLWPVSTASELNSERAMDLPSRLVAHEDIVQTVCFSADSQLLISGGADRTLRVWDMASGALEKTFERPDRVRSIAASPDGLMVSSGDDCQIALWDLNTLKHVQDVSTGPSRIWSVGFQQQADKLLLSAGGDKQTLALWQVNVEKEAAPAISRASLRSIRTYRGYTNGIRAVAFLSEESIVGGGDCGELSAWDRAGQRKATLPFHEGRIWALAVDRENKRIASASDDYLVRLWNAETGACLTTLAGHNNWVRDVDFSAHGRFLASAGDDCTIRVWNTASGHCRRVLALEQSHHWIRSVKFDPTNSRYLIGAGDEQIVRHWDIKENISRSIVEHTHRICAVAYSPDGRKVASASDDTTVALCDVSDIRNVQLIHRFDDADLGVKAVAFSPDGRYLAAGGDDQLVYLWDLESASPIDESGIVLRPTDYAGFSGGIRSLAFSPDGRYLVSGGLDEMIRMADLSEVEEPSKQVLKPLFVRDRPYESIKIEGVTGLSQLQLANLVSLGAVNQKASLLM